LASHPDVTGVGERAYTGRGLQQLPSAMKQAKKPLDCLAELRSDDAQGRQGVADIAQWHLKRLAAVGGATSQRIVDKMPDNYL
jgi:hypothetical protein